MLKSLDLEQFKCFEELHLPLERLTLLTGFNAAGKSSVLQAIVLLHQTVMENEWSTRLNLDGSVISLGSASDVINETGRNNFGIGLTWDECACFWKFEADDRKGLWSREVITATQTIRMPSHSICKE